MLAIRPAVASIESEVALAGPEHFERCLILTGPTGSGKSALALEIASRLNGEIVAMDSMTVYRGLDIGTAKPTAAERQRVPHHLIDVLDPWEAGNVAWWLDLARGAVQDIEARGRLAMLVGGTPLYLKAVLFGLFKAPPADAAVRQRLEAIAEHDGEAALHERLRRVDPAAAARLHPNDRRRLIRALEVHELTGRPLSEQQREWTRPTDSARSPEVVCLDLPRAELYARIDERVLAMLDAGWLDEAKRVRELPRPLSREAAAAVGYRDLWRFLDGRQDWPKTVASIQQQTRNYAKRQLTWFRHLPFCRFLTVELTRRLGESRIN